jgi:uncharacterized protein YbaP (TraB family)
MKKFLSWILILCMCLSLVACASSENESIPTTVFGGIATTTPAGGETSEAADTTVATESQPLEEIPTEPVPVTPGPLLYKVTDKNGNTAWLFGSIHAGREDYYPLPDYVMNAFNGADALAVESNVVAQENDQAATTQIFTAMVYKDGTTIKDHIPAELYDRCVAVLQAENTYLPALDMFHGFFWMTLIQELALNNLSGDMMLGVDRHLMDKATAAGKPILEVENIEEHYYFFEKFSDEVTAMALESTVEMYENPEEADAELIEMMDLWVSGDEQAFADYLASEDDDMTPEEQKLYAEYNQVLISDRNLSMADWTENALASGDEVFIVVGAAHVVGEGALVDLLTQRGYTVERVTG